MVWENLNWNWIGFGQAELELEWLLKTGFFLFLFPLLSFLPPPFSELLLFYNPHQRDVAPSIWSHHMGTIIFINYIVFIYAFTECSRQIVVHVRTLFCIEMNFVIDLRAVIMLVIVLATCGNSQKYVVDGLITDLYLAS